MFEGGFVDLIEKTVLLDSSRIDEALSLKGRRHWLHAEREELH